MVIFSIGLLTSSQAFADHDEITIENAQGSSTPGCEPECFIPSVVTIKADTEVTWHNGDTAAHTATSGSAAEGADGLFDSSLIMAGGSYTKSFEGFSSGSYDYHCAVHPWMQGTIIIEGADITPPVVTVPSNQSFSTSNSTGVMYYDIGDPSVIDSKPQHHIRATDSSGFSSTSSNTISIFNSALVCDRSDGVPFGEGWWLEYHYPVGTTTVTCTATDAAGNVGTASFTITVILVDSAAEPAPDTILPQVLVPDDITIETDNQDGASATFNPQAIDNIDELLTPTCNYTTGSVFPVGTTTVTCTATDAAGNTNSISFNVTIEFTGFSIPNWIKNVAGFWHAGDINNASFLEAIAYLIEHNIIVVPPTEAGSGGGEVPEWVKNNAGWWADGSIDDETFVNAIQYLIQQGILQV